jgi:hypothetical protein
MLHKSRQRSRRGPSLKLMHDRRWLRTAALIRHNENAKFELPRLGVARGSSRSPEPHSDASPAGGISVRDAFV